MAIASGVPIEVVMSFGHCSAEMTRHYTHLALGHKRVAAEKFAAHASAIGISLGLGIQQEACDD
jgi:hypothetical protein